MTSSGQNRCPGPEKLQELQSGDLRDEAFESLASHVSECEECSLKIDELDTADSALPTILLDKLVVSSGFGANGTSASRFSSDLQPVEEQVPQQVGDYEILELIGQGGMGLVYKARHCELHRNVAIKFLPERLFNRPDARRRFDREMKAAGLCDHPNIVRTHDARKIGDLHFFVMEYVEGRTLSTILADDGPFDVADACAIASEVARALQYIYDRNLVHRDIKPSNVMLTDAGEVKLLDLGLSRVQSEPADNDATIGNIPDDTAHGESALTITAGVLGTSSYMSPEQWRSASETDIRADVYSLGCTLFHMLSGQPPFSGDSYTTNWRSALAHRSMPPRRLSAFRSDVPETLEVVIRRMLAKEPEQRYTTPNDVHRELLPFCAESKSVVFRGAAEPSASAVGERHRRPTWQLVSALAVLAIAIAWFVPKGIGDTSNHDQNSPAAASIPNSDSRIVEYMSDGYDAFEAKDFEKAEQLFLRVRQLDEAHEGAVFAWIRANFHLGNVSAAGEAAQRIPDDGTPEKAALKGLCDAAIRNHRSAIRRFEEAIAGGLATKEVLTNLGFSLRALSRNEEAVKVLEEVRRMGGNTTTANLILNSVYYQLWLQRDETGKYKYDFDAQYLVKLIDECDDVPAKFRVASEIYIGIGQVLAQRNKDPATKQEWAKRSVAAFRQGLEVGLHPAYWNGIKNSMPQSILDSEEANQFAAQAAGPGPTQHRTFYLLDPIVGTRFDRWTARKLPPPFDWRRNLDSKSALENQIAQLVNDGYDAFEANELTEADTLLSKATRMNPLHEGAVLGLHRTRFRLAIRNSIWWRPNEFETERFFSHSEIPEIQAWYALCHAAAAGRGQTQSATLSIVEANEAIERGLDTFEVLSNLGFCLLQRGDGDDAIRIFERACGKSGNNSIPRLLQVQAYPLVWQRRSESEATVEELDVQLLVNLLEDCHDGIAKSYTAAITFARIAFSISDANREEREMWAERSFSEFARACDLGLDPLHWQKIEDVMPESIQQSSLGRRFSATVYSSSRLSQESQMFLLDPLVGTRFDRWTDPELH